MSDSNASGENHRPFLPQPSRRQYLKWTAAGLAASLLQACGGGGGGGGGSIPALAAGAGSGSGTASSPASVDWFRTTVLASIKRSGSSTTAVSAALLADEGVIWSEAFGNANPDTGQKATTDTRFNIGSVAKVVAALSAMILRDRGLLSLDQPVVELLPSFGMLSPRYTQITVRQLISHSSGFPGVNFRNVFGFAPMPGYAQDTLKSLALSHLKHDPGELAVYCNDGFTMVELLVLQLTGQSYTDFVQQVIFGPLGMTLSGFALSPAPEGAFAHPFYQGRMLGQEMPAAFATGGVISTPNDMMKLARMLLDGGMYSGQRIVSADGLQQMGIDQTPRLRINLTPGSSIGLGWDIVSQLGMAAGGLHAWAKNGDTIFFSSQFFVLPEARLAMFVSGNGHDYGSLSLTEGLLLRTAVERGAIAAMPSAIVSVVPSPVSPAPSVANLVGIYGNHSAPIQVLAASDGSLTVRQWSEAGWAVQQAGLRARSDGRWWSDAQTGTCYSFATAEGNRYLMRRRPSDNQLYWQEEPVGQWLPPVSTPLPAAWQARMGSRWLSINDDPQSVEAQLGPRIWLLAELAEMPGYVLWDNAQLLSVVDDDHTGMNIKIPVNAGRELVELRMAVADGAEEMHCGTLIFHRMAG